MLDSIGLGFSSRVTKSNQSSYLRPHYPTVHSKKIIVSLPSLKDL